MGHALNGNPHVSEITRERVIQAASELGYSAQSNPAARSLIAQRYGSKKKKDAFAVLVSGLYGVPIRKLPYYIPMLDGIELEAAELELDVSLHNFRKGHNPRYIDEFLVDGVIGFTTTPERNEWMHQHGLPQVMIDGSYDGFSGIFANHIAGIALCTQHLIDLGHRHIAYFCQTGDMDWRLGRERLESYEDTMTRNGLIVDPNLIWRECPQMQRTVAAEAMSRVLAGGHKFTAIVCYNDLFAMGVIDALNHAGLRVPADISVTGFDDISREYGFTPAITSVTFDREEMGRQAVRMLYRTVDEVIVNPLDTPSVIETIVPVKLAIHESTAPISSV